MGTIRRLSVIVVALLAITAGGASAVVPKATVTVTKTGSGKVVSDPLGLKCGADTNPCSAAFRTGRSVKLTATPSDGWALGSWGGACTVVSGKVCKIYVDGAKSVTVSFVKLHKLTAEVHGPGRIVSDPEGIRCEKGGDRDACTETYRNGTSVTLNAKPDDHALFEAWGGACAGQATPTPCVLDMTEPMIATATFVQGTATDTATGTASAR